MSLVRRFLSRHRLTGLAAAPHADLETPNLTSAARRPGRPFRPVLLVCAVASLLFALASPVAANTAMQQYVEAMQPGWNLGNTLDATPTETSWGNPLVTQAFIQQVAAQGFKSIRIPVTWDQHLGPAPGYTVDPAWMDRVQQIVDWSLDAGLYVMLNMHHDSAWVRTMPSNHDAVLARYSAVWTQIAARFRDHSDKLMFESINEPTFDGVDSATKIALLNELNVAFFHIVRDSGGGNATRPLVLPSVETNAGQDYLDALSATITQLNDPNLIGTVHNYGYWPFSVNISGVTRFDTDVQNWTTHDIDAVYTTLVAKSIPVVMGEFGLLSFDGYDGAVERGEALKFFEYLTSYARSKGITYEWWDAGAFFDRTTYQWKVPELYRYIMHSVVGRSSTADTDLIFLRDGTPLQDAVINLNLNGNSFVSLSDGATPLSLGADYLVDGSVLTIKASALAAYASGALGEKTVLNANFTGGGPAWQLFVRHQSAPVLAAASGTKSAGAGFVIPVAFNGDRLATIEAKYVDAPHYPYPGDANWTSFQQYSQDYLPDYTNNTLTLTPSFLSHTTNDSVDVTLHFWSGKMENYRLTFQAAGDIGGTPQEWAIYQDGLIGWNNWGSWAANNPAETTVVHSGTAAISVDAGGWGALVLGHNPWEPAVDTSAYRTLVFWINGGPVGGQKLGVGVGWGIPWVGIPALQANTWTKVEIPLADLGAEGKADISNVMFQNWTGGNAPTFYVDDIKLTTAYASTLVFVNGTPAPVITSATTAGGEFGVPFSYTTTATDTPATFTATNLPPGLTIDPTTGVIAGTPSAAGTYAVALGVTNADGSGAETLTIKIAPAPVDFAPVAAGSFSTGFVASYDGGAQPVQVSTSPAGVPVTITYNGSTNPPTLPGTYDVVVASADPNYTGTAHGTLVIRVTAQVRHAPVINGELDGSVQVLTGESLSLPGSGVVSGDLLAAGLPTVQLHGHPTFAGVVDADGALAPMDYTVTLDGRAVLRHVVRRVDPSAMPVVAPPAAPVGTRDVTLNKTSDSVGSFSNIRNLTLNGNAGAVALPAGVYGTLVVNGNSSVVVGVAGATEPAVYELQGLMLNGHASLTVLGPVTLKLASGVVLNGVAGSSQHPEWLDLQIASGGLTVNGAAVVSGSVTAPSGSVVINGTVEGRIIADQLTINGSGVLQEPAR